MNTARRDAGESWQPAVRPPGYPVRYQRLVRLQDGRLVGVRPIVPADAPALAEAIKTADPDTIRRRFLGGRPQVTPELITHLTTVDYRTRFALVAIDPHTGRGVAIARYETSGEHTAEVAVVVRSGWRHAGLGTELLRLLAHAASEQGIHTFTGSYLAENRAVAALIEDADVPARQVIDHGIAEFALPLEPGDDGSAAG